MRHLMRKYTLSGATALLFCFLSATVWGQATSTPNATLTPPCSPAGTLGNSTPGITHGLVTETMRGSIYTLSSPATVYSLMVYCDAPPANMQLVVGIYSGSTGTVGNLMVQSTVQNVFNGWNGFVITPTYLPAGTYWLLYQSNGTTSFNVSYSAGSSNIEAFTSTSMTFGTMPNTMPTPSYGTGQDSIYGLYCLIPTNTPTNTSTPTVTNTPTNSPTNTATNTITNTGTILTNTPTATPTSTATNTPTNSPTSTPSATPNLSLTPSCGSSFASFGEAVTTGGVGPVTAQSVELRACFYNLPVAGTIQTMSLYSTAYSAGSIAEVALYTNNAGTTNTMGTLIAQSVTQTLSAGWNNFEIPSSPLAAGNYWLAYIYAAPVSYSLIYQTSPAAVNTLAYTLASIPSWTFDNSALGYSLSYGNDWYEPILANYCPGLLATNTPTNSPTITPTNTVTNTPTNTGTPTITNTPTNTGTNSPTNTVTNTPTITLTNTVTNTPTLTPTNTVTNTLTNSPTNTVTNSPTNTPSNTLTNSPTNTLTNTSTNTVTNTSTNTPSLTPTNTPTSTPTNTSTNTVTHTPTITLTPIFSYTPTNSPTNTLTSTSTNTPTNSATNSPTDTATNTATSSSTNTVTNSPTNSPTNTSTHTPTLTVTGTLTPTATFTYTPSLTSTNTPVTFVFGTATITPTASAINAVSMVPNPITGTSGTHIQIVFDEPHDYVVVKLYTIAFRKIYEDRVNYAPAGTFAYYLDPNKFKGGANIGNGLYYVTITTPTNHWIMKLLVLR